MADADKLFAGSIPKLYEQYLVPLIFGPYAADIVARLKSRPLSRVLEVAAGTGVVTRALAQGLDANVDIVATDLNQAMLDEAAALGTARSVEWRAADAMALPFEDASFDAVVCQFGVMFFPDKTKAFAEARRVLKPGGTYIFNVWDRLSENEFAETVHDAMAAAFPENPPGFLARTPYGYFQRNVIERALREAGFSQPIVMDTVSARSRAASAHDVALAYCQGTPLRNEIETRGSHRLAEATEAAATALSKRFGERNLDAKIQAQVFVTTA